MQAFVAVVDHGSFTAAAGVLGISQASVSRAVARLEAAIGATVLHRSTRTVSLTAAGARILTTARALLDDVAAIEHLAATVTHEVRVGHAWAALGRHTTAVQRRWDADHPEAELRFVHANTSTAGLSEHLADIGILRRPLTDDRYVRVLAGTEQRVVAVAADHAFSDRDALTLNDLTGHTVAIDPLVGSTTVDLWPTGEGPGDTRVTSGIEDWLGVIAAGHAIGLSSEASAHLHPRPGLRYIPVRDAPPIAVTIAWRRDDPPAAADAFVQLVCNAYSEALRSRSEG